MAWHVIIQLPFSRNQGNLLYLHQNIEPDVMFYFQHCNSTPSLLVYALDGDIPCED